MEVSLIATDGIPPPVGIVKAIAPMVIDSALAAARALVRRIASGPPPAGSRDSTAVRALPAV
jgi:hypothetical protein